MMDFDDVVGCPDFAQDEPVPVIRNSGAGYDSDGEPIDGTNTTLLADGIITKATAKELKQLPQGELKAEVIKFITETEILVSENDMQSDRIIWHNARYKIIKVDDNSDFGFYRAFGVYEGKEA